jgi:hypothetical protein
MKERLRAPIEKIKEKLGPKLEPFRPHVEKMRSLFFRIYPYLLQKARWFAYSLILPIFLFFVVLIGFFLIYPANELRPWVSEQLTRQLGAESFRVGEMRWDHSLRRLSLGVRLENIHIEKGDWFSDLSTESVRLSIEPISMLLRGTPFEVHAIGLQAELLSHAKIPPITNEKPTPDHSKLALWAQSLVAQARGHHIRVERGRVSFVEASQVENSFHLLLTELDLDVSLSSNWRQKISMSSLIQTGDSKNWLLAGPINLESESEMRMAGGRPLSINFEKFHLDLSRINGTAFRVFERISDGPFHIHAKPQIVFSERDGRIVLSEFVAASSDVMINDLKVKADFRSTLGSETHFDWLVGRSEVKALHLPLKGLRRAPGRGIVSSSGRIVFRDRFETSEASWRTTLNNFIMDASYLASLWGSGESAEGELKVSLVSEGGLRGGRLSSEKNEIQIDATAMGWEPPHSRFVKPKGIKAQALLRFSQNEEKIDVHTFDLDLHTLKMQSTASVSHLISRLRGASRPLGLEFRFRTNNVDFSEWSNLFTDFRRMPLQGLFETRGSVLTDYWPENEKMFQNIDWNFDKLQFSNIRGNFDASGNAEIGFRENIVGPFDWSLFFIGRGRGTRVDRGRLLTQLDLSQAAIALHDKFRKPRGVPFVLQISADQSRNRVNLDKGQFRFADLDMDFSGVMIQGQGRSRLALKMKQAVNLAEWKEFFLDPKIRDSLRGTWRVDGSFGLDSNFESEKDIDWASLTFDGDVRINDLSWASEMLGESFDNISGRIRFLEDSVNLSPITIRKGAQNYSIDGTLKPLRVGSKKSMLYLSDWFRSTAWHLTANVQMPQLELSSLLKKRESRDRYTFPDTLIDAEWIKQSRAELNLSLANVRWEQKVLAENLLGKLDYRGGRWILRPFSAVYKKGKAQGSASLDLTPVWLQDADPQWALSVKLENIPTNELPLALGLEGGRVSGDLTLTSQGRYFYDWEQALRTRGLLRISNATQSLWLRPLSRMVNEFFETSPARDYLLSDATREKCEVALGRVSVEVQQIAHETRLERFRHETGGGSRLDLEAVLTSGDSQELEATGKAAFKFANNCFSPRAQSCLEELTKGSWPLDFSTRKHRLSRLAYGFNVKTFGENFKVCMARKVSEAVKDSATR